MKRILSSLLAGATIVVVVACGASKKSANVGAAPVTSMDAAPPGGMHDPRIVELEAKINAELEKLGIKPPPSVTMTCPQPPCNATALNVKPTADPNCKHGESQACKDICTLADSICDNAKKICEIAKELANDSWANEKCAGAETSCETARGKCCGCV